MEVLSLIGYIAMLYIVLGIITMIVMHARGLKRIDASVAGSGFIFRLLISPGLIALWPVMISKLLRGSGAGSLESPVSATGMRRLHGAIIAMVSVAVPIVAGAGFMNRPPISPIPERGTVKEVAWSIDSTTSEAHVVTAQVLDAVEEPQLVYWLTTHSETPVFLGAFQESGTHYFAISGSDSELIGDIRIYEASSGQWETALQIGGAA